VFREKPFGRAYNWANFANVKREQRPKGYPKEAAISYPTKTKRETQRTKTELASKKLESSYKHL
jgi:hypothetical protein